MTKHIETRRRREERVVRALRANGVLRSPLQQKVGLVVRLLAAASVLLGVGTGGYLVGVRDRPTSVASGPGLVQARGQAYVQSVSALTETVTDDSLSYEQARDAAISAMLAAAYALTRVRPTDTVATRLTAEIHRIRASTTAGWIQQ